MRHVSGGARFRFALLALSLALGAARAAHAQGYGLYEQGNCAMGRAGAGVASPCSDGSAIFFNPAGLAAETAPVLSATITGVAPRGAFTNSTTGQVSPMNDRIIPAPAAYFAMPLAGKVVIGAGLMAPYGLITDWPSGTAGRYLGYYSSLRSVYVQPTAAVRLSDRVTVGGGVDITRTSLELKKRVDLSTLAITGTSLTFGALGVPRGTDFADVDLSGSGMRVGGHVGVLVRASDRVSVGARYLTGQTVSIDNGEVAIAQIPTNLALAVALPGLPAGTPLDAIVRPSFAAGAALSNQTAQASMPLPAQFVAGIAVTPAANLLLLADYQFTQWSVFDTITIVNQYAPPTVMVESYRNTHGARIGAEYSLGRTTIRAGLDVHGAAAPDQTVTPLLPEAAREDLAGGVSLPLGGKARLDLAYMWIRQHDRAGRTTDGGMAVPTVAVNSGTYQYRAHLFSAGLVMRF